jgi:hypothetical protein
LPSHPADEGSTPRATQGKGRPTPTRKEAEAAARERAKLGTDRKALAKQQRSQRSSMNRQLREAYKTGDDAHLPARDKGPVKRYLRDFVDSRIGFAELFAPMLILILILSAMNPVMGQGMWVMSVVLVLVDIFWIRFRARRGVRQRFPGQSLKGVTYYAVVRSLNLRILRLPKPQVKIGTQLPDTYR